MKRQVPANPFLRSSSEKHHKLFSRLRAAIFDGRFHLFSGRRKQNLLDCLSRYEQRLRAGGFAVAAGAALLLPAAALAQPMMAGTEFQVNTWTTDKQWYPSVSKDSDGDFVIAWGSVGQDGDGYGIYAQRYNSAGIPQGIEFQVNTWTTGNQTFPSVAMDSDGDFVIAWSSIGQEGSSGSGIHAQRFNSTGVPQGNEFQVNTSTENDQSHPSVAMDSNGNFVVAWQSGGQDGNSDGIYARRYNSAGVAQGGEFLVNTWTTDSQSCPSVAMDSDGDFVVSWQSTGQDGQFNGIYAQLYNSAGIALGLEFRVNSWTTNYQSFPSVAMDSNGDFVVAWTSGGQDTNSSGIYAQRFNSTGEPQGGEFRVNTWRTNIQRFPSAAMNSNGDFVVSWHSMGQDGDSYGIYAQLYNSAGVKQRGEFQVNTWTTQGQLRPSVAMDSDGAFVVVWHSSGQDGYGYGIYAQRFLPGIANCDLPAGLFTNNILNNSATLNWELVPGAKAYKILLQNLVTKAKTSYDISPNQVSLIISGLTNNTPYKWWIKAKCPMSGWTIASPWQLFTTTNLAALEAGTTDMPVESGQGESRFLQGGRMVIQPNPAGNAVTLNSPDQAFQLVRILDQIGRVVFERGGLNNNQLEIDTRELPQGMYYLQAQSGSERLVMPLVIIK